LAQIGLKKVVKEFGNFVAVKGINLNVQDGEFLILIGPSGCGKTTTLNMISGLETPTSGEIIIGNRIVNDVEPGERGLGMVFQDLALFPHMTVFENISFGLRVRKMPEQEIKEKVRMAADAMHILPLLSKRPAQCSGGEAQRVALARTIVNNPSVFLMDEPLSSLDAKLRVDMRTELKGLHERLNATFVYVTHDQAEAMTMADRIVVMNGGLIEQVGGPLDIYDLPASHFVAGFFGTPTMNFLKGEIVSENGNTTFSCPHIEQSLGNNIPKNLIGETVTLGVRSEHITVNEGSRQGQVRLVEPLGDSSLVFFEYGGEDRLVAKVAPELRFAPGDQITYQFQAAKCHLFGINDGRRLN